MAIKEVKWDEGALECKHLTYQKQTKYRTVCMDCGMRISSCCKAEIVEGARTFECPSGKLCARCQKPVIDVADCNHDTSKESR